MNLGKQSYQVFTPSIYAPISLSLSGNWCHGNRHIHLLGMLPTSLLYNSLALGNCCLWAHISNWQEGGCMLDAAACGCVAAYICSYLCVCVQPLPQTQRLRAPITPLQLGASGCCIFLTTTMSKRYKSTTKLYILSIQLVIVIKILSSAVWSQWVELGSGQPQLHGAQWL